MSCEELSGWDTGDWGALQRSLLKTRHQFKTQKESLNEYLSGNVIEFCLHERLWVVAAIRLEITVMHNSGGRLIRSVPRSLCEHCETLSHIKKKEKQNRPSQIRRALRLPRWCLAEISCSIMIQRRQLWCSLRVSCILLDCHLFFFLSTANVRYDLLPTCFWQSVRLVTARCLARHAGLPKKPPAKKKKESCHKERRVY